MAQRGWLETVMAGERRGLRAAAWRTLMWLPLLGYAAGNAMRQLQFRSGLRRPARLPVPVISVGNLSAGGTGKTPAVIWLARQLQARLAGRAGAAGGVGMLSRGYRAAADGTNDEMRVIAQSLPDVPHVTNSSRFAAGRQLLAAHPDTGCLLLDDGFSHRQLARDLDIVLIDATRPFGVGELLPRGLLREPPGALRRADAVILTRADQADPAKLETLHQRVVRCLPPGAPVVLAEHAVVGWRSLTGDELPLTDLDRAHVVAAAGIGNPDAFVRSLEHMGATVLALHSLPDHHAWTGDDVQRVATAAPAGSRVVVTSKDAVKLATLADPPLDWCVLEVAFRLRESAAADGLRAMLDRLVDRIPGDA